MAGLFGKWRKKHDTSVVPMVLGMLVVLGLLIWGFTAMILYLTGWRTFKNNLSEDVAFAREHQSLTVSVDGEPVDAASDGGSQAMDIILGNIGMGKTQKPDELPDGKKGIRVDFGNGSLLYVVKTEIDAGDKRTKTGILLTYIRNGEVLYCYDADRLAQYAELLSVLKRK